MLNSFEVATDLIFVLHPLPIPCQILMLKSQPAKYQEIGLRG